MKKTEKTSWGKVASWYDDLLENSRDTFQDKVILPNLLRIVAPKVDQKILDLACGQGYFSRALAKAGAEVVGFDISPELIDFARKNSPKEIKYLVGNAENVYEILIDSYKKSSNDLGIEGVKYIRFDTVIIILALQNIKDMRLTIQNVSNLLRVRGRLIIVINHPAFRIPSKSSWVWDEKESKQYRRIDAYMSEFSRDIDMNPGHKDSIKTVSFHRPLQTYFKALNKASFGVTRLEEWISHKESQIGPRAKEEDRIRKEIPLFLCIESVKLS